MALNDYNLSQVQTTQDASVPTGTIQTPTTPPSVYATPPVDVVTQAGAQFDASQGKVPPEIQSIIDQNNQYKDILGLGAQAKSEQVQQFANMGGTVAQSQVNQLTKEYNMLDNIAKGKEQAYLANKVAGGGGTAGGVSTTFEGIQRENAVAKWSKLSDIYAAQNNVDQAKASSEQAILAKYGDVQAKIDSQKAFYDLNKDTLSRLDKKNYDKQQYILKQQQDAKDKKVADEKVVNNMLIEASPIAPPDVIARAKAVQAKGGSATEVAMALGQYGGDYYKTALLKEQIETQKSNRLTDAAQRAKIYSDIEKNKPIPITGVDGVVATLPKAAQDRYYKMQGDFDTATKTYRGAIDAAGSVKALSKDATAQDQTAIIFQYMKTLDPNSTVREGEFALVAATAGLGDRAVNAIKRLDNGQRLNEAQIKDIVGATDKLSANAKANLQATSKEYDRRASIQGLPSGLFLNKETAQVNPNDSPEAQAIKAKMEAANPALKKQVFEGTSIINNITGSKIDFAVPIPITTTKK